MKTVTYLKVLGAIGASSLLTACAGGAAMQESESFASAPVPSAALQAILARHELPAASVGVIKGGTLDFQVVHGTQRPGVPVDENTRFDAASVTKTVMAEVALRLAARGAIDLDEPLHLHWVDPDVATDPRLRSLTARHVLTHRTGFPNWRFFREDRKLAFERAPGAAFGYSGEGFQYLGRALEAKLGKPLPIIFDEELFQPLGITSAVITNRELADNFAMLRDEEGQLYHKHCRPGFCFPAGDWSVAGGLAISVADYAAILTSAAEAEGYGEAWAQARDTIVTDKGNARTVNCERFPNAACPDSQGYGLGFEVMKYPQGEIIGHTGGDWSTLSVAYIAPSSGDGAVIFLSGAEKQTLPAMVELLAEIDADAPYYWRFLQTLENRRSTESF